jgi:hypothetical protein
MKAGLSAPCLLLFGLSRAAIATLYKNQRILPPREEFLEKDFVISLFNRHRRVVPDKVEEIFPFS